MEKQIEEIIKHYTIEKWEIALISVIASIITFLISSWLKNFFEGKMVLRKLETEHKFNQQKLIKEVLARNKVHLLAACENLNHRCWNFSKNHNQGWMSVSGNYTSESYYFHSFAYRILEVFAWMDKIQAEMIYLDTTIATKTDLEFIKFLKIFPQIFCDLTFIEGQNANGNLATDHFFRNNFENFSKCILTANGTKSYSEFIDNLSPNALSIKTLYMFLEEISPTENRKRWDRIHLFHITIILFLNNYGYDFQVTNEEKIKTVLTNPKKSGYLNNYLKFLEEYHIENNSEVKKLKKIISNLP